MYVEPIHVSGYIQVFHIIVPRIGFWTGNLGFVVSCESSNPKTWELQGVIAPQTLSSYVNP
jgi:hypothetical protein